MVAFECRADLLTKIIAERIGIFMEVFWAGGGCLLHFVNGIIWRNDSVNRAPVFCDISEYPEFRQYNR